MISSLAPMPTRTIEAGGYSVVVGTGLDHQLVQRVTSATPAHHYAVITDENVASLHAEPLRATLKGVAKTSLHVMGTGESHKTRETWGQLTDSMLAAGCGRDSVVVAVGGGVVGDMAGFVAATFMRGIPVVQYPTSLLAMIDASVGGKTGVDTPVGKNLVGAFHPPAVVIADVDTLRTLPIMHRRAGLAEAIKHGAIADAAYFDRLAALMPMLIAGESAAMLEIVARSVEIKAGVVREDPRELGRRKILNFGHTLGHAIETSSGFALLHGEAIAIGMVLESRLAELLGIAVPGTALKIERLAAEAGLPVSRPPSISAESVLDATRHDKKARRGRVAYVLPAHVGAAANAERGWVVEVDDDSVSAVLQ